MPLIQWSDDLNIGVEAIDDQHRRFVDIINELTDAINAGGSKETVEKSLAALADYAEYHFSSEEALMEKHGYKERDDQLKKHNMFREKVEDFQARYPVLQTSLGIVIIRFLKEWFRDHLTGTDKKLGEFLNGKGVR